MKFKKISKILVGLMTATFVFVGCGNSNKGGESSTGNKTSAQSDTFIYGIEGDPGNSVNVITTSDRFGLMQIKLTYSPLYMYNADGINYFLAESMEESEDHLTYTAKLRKDVKWSDGEQFTADDVVFTYNEMLKEENAGWAYSQLIFNGKPVKIEKVDDYTVNFVLPEVSAPAIELLANIFIMPKHIYEGESNFANSEKNAKPVGTGPYILEEYKAGQYVKFVKNENYFLGKPQISNVIFRTIQDANTAKLSLQKGEINALVVQSSDLDGLMNDSLTSYTYDEGRIAYMVLNSNSPKLQDKKVRQAIFYALNRTDLINAAFGSEEYAAKAYTFLPNENSFHADNVEKYEYNLEKAKQLLGEAGVSGLKLKLGYAGTNVPYQKDAAIIQQNLKAVGIDLELAAGEDAAISQEMKNAQSTNYDMFLGGYIMGIDPDTFNSLFTSESLFNYSHYKDTEIDDLFNAGRVETDGAKRQEIYNKIQQRLQDNAYFYPILENKRILVMSSNVAGVEEAKLVPVYTFEDMSKLYLK